MTLDDLSDYPCPCDLAPCSPECAEAVDACVSVTCQWLDIYRDSMTMREAILGDLTPEEAAAKYRRYAQWEVVLNTATYGPNDAHFAGLADVAEGM